MKFISLVGIAILLIIHSGCVTVDKVSEASQPDVDLKNTRWVLNTLKGKKFNPGDGHREVYILLRLHQSVVQGNGGCSGIVGEYSLGKNHALSFGGMQCAMAHCTAMEIEAAFIQLLQAIDRYEISGEQLTLLSKGKAVLTFSAVYL